MGKIICKVCGSSYPDTAEQCPFCGYVNPENSQGAMGDGSSLDTNGTYHYVRGGRFSKSNVKKRNKGKMPAVRNTTTDKIAAKQEKTGHNSGHDSGQNNDSSRKKPVGIVIVSIILILAIIAVVIYLSMQFFGPNHNILPDGTTVPSTTAYATETVPQIAACESITLNVSNITFEKLNASRMLYVKTVPEKVQETVVYSSDNEEVATVSQNGMVTAVGPGEAIITVKCGEAKVQCVVSCDVPEETTEETTVPEETTISPEEFKLNRKDMTLDKKGATWILYDGDIGKTQIKFSSDNPDVATFDGGTVKAVGRGTTTVRAEYMGKKVSCIVRCSFSESSGVEGNGGGVSEDVGQTLGGNYRIHTIYGDSGGDITLANGKSLELFLKDENGNVANTTWQVDGSGVSISGSTIKRVASGTCVVSTTYNGKTYKLFVR